jgi:hypothetical protein
MKKKKFKNVKKKVFISWYSDIEFEVLIWKIFILIFKDF